MQRLYYELLFYHIGYGMIMCSYLPIYLMILYYWYHNQFSRHGWHLPFLSSCRFDVASLVPVSSPVLILQHVVVPIQPSKGWYILLND